MKALKLIGITSVIAAVLLCIYTAYGGFVLFCGILLALLLFSIGTALSMASVTRTLQTRGVSAALPLYLSIGKTKTLILGAKSVTDCKAPALYDIYSPECDKLMLLKICSAAAKEYHFAKSGDNALAKCFFAVTKAVSEFSDDSLPRLNFKMSCKFASCTGASFDTPQGEYVFGTKKFLSRRKIPMPFAVSRIDCDENSMIYAAKNRKFCGFFRFCDSPKGNMPYLFELMRSRNLRAVTIAESLSAFPQLKSELCPDAVYMADSPAKVKKVLQVECKNDRIGVMTADAGDCGNISRKDGLTVAECSPENAVFSVLVCRELMGFVKQNALLSAVFATALMLVSGVAGGVSAFASVFAISGFTAFCIFASKKIKQTLPAMSEVCISEKKGYTKMFGKINYTLKVEGMSCSHCSARVKSALEAIKGVSANISLEEKTARVKCPASVSAEELSKAVTEAGYTVLSAEKV